MLPLEGLRCVLLLSNTTCSLKTPSAYLLPHCAHTAALHYTQPQDNNDTLFSGYNLQTLLHALASKANGTMKRFVLV